MLSLPVNRQFEKVILSNEVSISHINDPIQELINVNLLYSGGFFAVVDGVNTK